MDCRFYINSSLVLIDFLYRIFEGHFPTQMIKLHFVMLYRRVQEVSPVLYLYLQNCTKIYSIHLNTSTLPKVGQNIALHTFSPIS